MGFAGLKLGSLEAQKLHIHLACRHFGFPASNFMMKRLYNDDENRFLSIRAVCFF
jgi:hypothetical protein